MSLAMIALNQSLHYLTSKMYSVKIQESVHLQFQKMREVYSAVSTDMEISLSVHLQFYLFSGDEMSLFS